MKKLLFLSISLFLVISCSNKKSCFLAKENNKIIKKEGNCKLRHAPCSTFKIPLSLIGYDSGLLVDELEPVWQYKKGYIEGLDVWKQPHNPKLWMKNSCVWYSQVLTQKLGIEKFKEYIALLNYGNQDISGDKGKNNGLTNSWLSSSLTISPEEQITFLEAFLDPNHKALKVSPKAYEMTKKILFIESLYDGWDLYGKTGSGRQLSEDKTTKLELQIGWFIGWIQKDNRKIIFANFIHDNNKQSTFASFRARDAAKKELIKIIKNLNRI